MDDRVVERLLKFIMYGFFSMMCVQYSFDKQSLYKAIFIFGFIHIWYLFAYATRQIQAGMMSIDDTMDLSYTSLIYLFSGIEVVEDHTARKSVRIVAFMLCAGFVCFLVGVSVNRGALLSVACYFVLRFLDKQPNVQKRTFFFVSVMIAGVIMYVYLVPILKAVNSIMVALGIVIKPLQKTIQQMEWSDSMISGRESVYNAAVQLISEAWLLPCGVAGFHIQKGIYYPHNIFLESGIEFGLIGLIIVMMIILRACHCMIVKLSKNSDLILIFFCLSIPRLMVSSSYWENTFIWPMMVLMWSNEKSVTTATKFKTTLRNQIHNYLTKKRSANVW